MFRDPELFEQDMWAYEILNKIKIWYGTVKSNDDNNKWYRFNNEIINEIKDMKKEIFEFGMPHVLFYERIE